MKIQLNYSYLRNKKLFVTDSSVTVSQKTINIFSKLSFKLLENKNFNRYIN